MAFDLRDALRGLARDRLYSLTTILTLALTVGATTAVFSIVNGVLLKPLAYRDSQQLVAVREVVRELADKYPMLPANPRHFARWREKATAFASIAEMLDMPANLTGVGEPAQVKVLRTSGAVFDVLKVTPALGRVLTREDEREDQPAVAVVSHAMWRDRLSSDLNAIGRSIVVDGKPYTVVGVLPPDVRIPHPGGFNEPGELTSAVDVFLPLRLRLSDFSLMGEFNYFVVARLTPGFDARQAEAELNVLQDELAREAEHETHERAGLRALVTPLSETITGASRRGLLLLLGAIIAVLLVACSNLANLSLTRSLAHSRDAAIRAALGAGRSRLVGRVILEQLVLAITGGVLGVGIAAAAIRVFVTTAPVTLPRIDEIAIDARVLTFALATSVVAGLIVAVAPAWRLAARDVQDVLRGGGLATTVDRAGLRIRSALLTVQIAVSVALLSVTALLALSFVRLLDSDRGFATDGIMAIDVSLPASRYAEGADRTRIYDRLLAGVEAVPGVLSASWISALPLTGETWVDLVAAEGDTRPFVQLPPANYRFVAPDYFKTMGIPITRGQSFSSADRGESRATMPAVVTARTAATLWPGMDPIGRRFRRGDPKEKPFEVVGIVPNGHTAQIDAESPLMVYVPYWYRSRQTASLVVRTTADPAAIAAAIRTALWAVDRDVAVARMRPIQQLVDESLAPRRYQTTLFVLFGAVALLIAMIGVYAVTAYSVSTRRREMNIRVALGAGRAHVLALIMRHGLVPLAAGILVGAAGATAIGRAVSTLLFEVSARDPRAIAAVASLVAVVGIASALGAARQAIAFNPAAALREE